MKERILYCFNSPVGILAVCAPGRAADWRAYVPRFNSPVGILAVCAWVPALGARPLQRCFNSPVGILAVCARRGCSSSQFPEVFQFPGWNSGRLCAGLSSRTPCTARFQFPGWNSGRLCRSFSPGCWPAPRFQFPGWNSGRLCDYGVFANLTSFTVSIPRLEFWPFVRGRHCAPARAGRSFNSPVGILAVCARPGAGSRLRFYFVSIPRLEFWPFVLPAVAE